jgi:hypothetical protein
MLISGFILAYLGSLTRSLISKATEAKLINNQLILGEKLKNNQFILGELIEKIHSASSLLMHHSKQLQNSTLLNVKLQSKSIKNTQKGILDCCSDLEETASSLRKFIKD